MDLHGLMLQCHVWLLLDAGAIDLNPSLEDVLETMRFLCVSELAWMDGAGLLESLYHCLYVFPEVREKLAKTGTKIKRI